MKNPAGQATGRRGEIIAASAKLFDKVGYHLASMNMIAEEVGLGKPTLYHYFKSKSEILFEMHQSLISELMESFAAHTQGGTPADEALVAIARDTVKFIKNNPGYIRAFFEHFDDLDDHHKVLIHEQRSNYLKMITEIVAAGMESGKFAKRDPRITSMAYLGMLNWTYQWIPSQKNKSTDEISDLLCSVFLEGAYA